MELTETPYVYSESLGDNDRKHVVCPISVTYNQLFHF